MAVKVKVDAQGRVVIPQAERERLGLSAGGALDLIATPEGLLLERRRRATVTVEEDGLPLVRVDELGTVSNTEAIDAIHQQRAGR
ncbi:AbrB/MazE/SpoVT family DNA-binding domain-containing protein [Nitriliruptor alkaliphilus]|uniref:AbrB/MazE/SpoVT family DNA-binding domain-containing protein n=1 Tax=Nitriliruptor alkaliphilus TaxID=427918 RepID=UPI000697D2DE|nr:AbrB/MazE/SpoVT family DNA-binding domain-containing protein [Nitriliruptor alkaliphilus]